MTGTPAMVASVAPLPTEIGNEPGGTPNISAVPAVPVFSVNWPLAPVSVVAPVAVAVTATPAPASRVHAVGARRSVAMHTRPLSTVAPAPPSVPLTIGPEPGRDAPGPPPLRSGR